MWVTRGEDHIMRQRQNLALGILLGTLGVVFGLSAPAQMTRARKDMTIPERIADATGGRAFFPFQIRDVANAFAEIQDELRSQYAVSYKPADFRTDGRYRTIEIVASDHKNLHVRSRRGYFAPAQ